MAGLYSRIVDLNHLIGVAITCHNNCGIFLVVLLYLSGGEAAG